MPIPQLPPSQSAKPSLGVVFAEVRTLYRANWQFVVAGSLLAFVALDVVAGVAWVLAVRFDSSFGSSVGGHP